MEQQVKFYIYSWFIDDSEEEITSIRIYGVNEKNQNVCARVDDFTPYIYIELPPERINWNSGKAQLVGNKIDELLGKQRPLKKVLMMKEKLYGAYLDKNGKAKLFPYLFCSFSSSKDIKVLGYKLRNNLHIVGLGAIKLKMHESNADPILQLTCCRHIPTAGWVEFYGKEQKEENSKLTLCDKEYKVKWKNISPITSDIIAKPKILGFDIEVNSTNPSAMPNAKKPGDKVFQISCVIARFGDPESKYEKYLLSLGQPDQEIVGEDVLIYTYETEADLLEGFTKFICEENPNLIVGYNILGFDIPYMIDRAKFNMCIGTFDQQGFHKFAHAKEKTIKWSSSAYKNQEFQFLDAEGRVFVDLLPLVRRDYKFDNYKLKTISDFFLGQTKDPLSVKGIFKCYRIGTKKNEVGEYSLKAQKALGLVGRYCLVDSLLTVLLMDKLQMWIGLTEMAKTCKTSIFSLYTQGQQIKVFSQLYQYCLDENIVVETDAYQVSENERFIGAKVFPPIKGRHGNVVPFDFASLYPSTIIAYNIDYHTWVPDDSDIPDSECHVMEWQDCVSCCHDPKVIRAVELTKYITSEQEIIKSMRDKRNKTLDKLRKKELMNDITLKLEELKPYVKERSDLNKSKSKFPMCCKRYYRFLKEPRGVLPTVIQNLLDARKHTRKVDMVDCYKKIDKLKADIDVDHSIEINDLKTLLNILDKRQLAYKISANSMYGAMGVRKGYLPFMPGAMVTCYMGRVNIEKVANEITTKYKGELIYGDTDTLLPDCPVLVSYNSKLEYKTMEELSEGDWKLTVTGKEISNAKEGLLVWSDNGFTPIKQVIRHAITKPLIRVLTHVGCVECTLDHSLLWENGYAAKASDVQVGSKLCIKELPLPLDTPKIPIYKNKLTENIIEDYIIPDVSFENMTAELAFVWGMFYAEGSCGTYGPYIKNGVTRNASSWAISGQDIKLLNRCVSILNKYEEKLQFKILDTMDSSNANKLVPFCKERGTPGQIVEFVDRYRNLFYDCRRSKRVPSIILNSPFDIRQSFFMGYYAGDGSKKDPAICLSNKGAIGSAGLFYIMKSIGYQVSINTRMDKPTIYKLTGSTPEKKMRYSPNVVKKIYPTDIYNSNEPLIRQEQVLEKQPEYIYDIETENHHFSAGVGELVVHNSNYITFPHLKTAHETWDYAIEVAKNITKLFPKPISLEFENAIYSFFFILTKKRYMYRQCLRDGIVDDKIGKRGVLLSRRDSSQFVRDIYESIIGKIADNISHDDICYWLLTEINLMFSGCKTYKDFVVTKAVGNSNGLHAEAFVNEKGVKKAKVGDYTVPFLSKDKEEREEQLKKKGADNEGEYYLLCLPAQVQLAERMRSRGQRVDAGSRLEYVVTNPELHLAKQYEKVESYEYFQKHSDVIKIDHFYYLKALTNPLDQMLDVAFPLYKDFVLNQYNFRWKIRHKLLTELKDLFKPKLVFD